MPAGILAMIMRMLPFLAGQMGVGAGVSKLAPRVGSWLAGKAGQGGVGRMIPTTAQMAKPLLGQRAAGVLGERFSPTVGGALRGLGGVGAAGAGLTGGILADQLWFGQENEMPESMPALDPFGRQQARELAGVQDLAALQQALEAAGIDFEALQQHGGLI